MAAAKIKRSRTTTMRMSAGRRRLTPAQVAEIRESRESLRRVAERFGISVGYACSIRTGKARRIEVAAEIRVTEAKRRPLPHEVLRPEPLFSGAGIGRYVDGHDSAIARAYGANVCVGLLGRDG
jgi:hypothetical protein